MANHLAEDKMNSHVVSKRRVEDHGEVFTPEREVHAMLDLVAHECERVDSKFLEPACGTGNFLVQILKRKLSIVDAKYSRSAFDRNQYTLLAVSSIYGIDLLPDNVEQCKKRLLGLIENSDEEVQLACKYILSKNIVCGDALSFKGIIFPEWSPVGGGRVKRRDFAFHQLVAQASITESPLFSDLGDEVFLPEPVKDYPLINFYRVFDAE